MTVLSLILCVLLQANLLLQKADEYLAGIDRLEIPAAQAEVDFMIGSVSDSTLRSEVAVKAYRHFLDSKIMGSENVAVHIFEKWFAPYRAVFPTYEEFDAAELYAFVNRSSLIGRQAQTLRAVDLQGREVTISSSRGRGRRSVLLFFYSTTCPKCLLYAHQLRDYLTKEKHPRVDAYFFYTGEDDSAWHKYLAGKNFPLKGNCRTRVFHVRSAAGDSSEDAAVGGPSDFVTRYGVVQTPRIFLVGADGRISGRCLDPQAVKTLLEMR